MATSIFTTFRYGTSGPCSKGDTTLQCLRKIETLKAAKESVRDRLKRLAKQVRKKEGEDAVLCGAVCCVVYGAVWGVVCGAVYGVILTLSLPLLSLPILSLSSSLGTASPRET